MAAICAAAPLARANQLPLPTAGRGITAGSSAIEESDLYLFLQQSASSRDASLCPETIDFGPTSSSRQSLPVESALTEDKKWSRSWSSDNDSWLKSNARQVPVHRRRLIRHEGICVGWLETWPSLCTVLLSAVSRPFTCYSLISLHGIAMPKGFYFTAVVSSFFLSFFSRRLISEVTERI